jgi:hypothetical protein
VKNNFWEDKQACDEKIKEFHSKEVVNTGVPDWIKGLNCPHCEEDIAPRSIQAISFKMNARNFGDFKVDIACDKCGILDYVYFRQAYENMSDICDLVTGEKIPESEAVVEEEMYKKRYNNILEKMLLANQEQ